MLYFTTVTVVDFLSQWVPERPLAITKDNILYISGAIVGTGLLHITFTAVCKKKEWGIFIDEDTLRAKEKLKQQNNNTQAADGYEQESDDGALNETTTV